MTPEKIQCSICDRTFTKSQVNMIALDTMVCGYCYRAMQAKPATVMCFGKISVFQTVDGKVVEVVKAYNPKRPECRIFCPDRRVCLRVISGKEL